MTFCTRCGSQLSEATFCTHCGQKVDEGPATAVLRPLQPIRSEPYAPRPVVAAQRSKAPVLAVAAIIAAGVGAGALTWALTSKSSPSTPVAATTSAAPTGPSSTAALTGSDAPSTPPSSGLPTTSANIDFTDVAGNTDLAAIGPVLDTYFTGVNAHDAAQAISVFSPRGATNPHDRKDVQQLASGIQSTADDRIRVTAIMPSSFAAADGSTLPTTAVRVEFRSQQDASDGYHGQTCSTWRIVYHLISVPAWTTAEGASHFQILGSEADAPIAC